MKPVKVRGNTLLLPQSALQHKQYFPKKKEIPWGNRRLLKVPHRLDETLLLRNLGYDAPSPILTQYEWPRPRRMPFVYQHQMETAAFCTYHRKLFILNEAGTGKTGATVWAIDYLMRAGVIENVLVICPKSCTHLVWEREFFAIAPKRKVRILDQNTKDKRLQAYRDPEAKVHIVNHHGLTVDALTGLFTAAKRKYDLIVLDETSYFRNKKNHVYNVLEKMLQAHECRFWVLTANPCPREPTEVWPLARLINPKGTPKYYGQFRQQVMYRVSEFKWAPVKGWQERVQEVMQPAIRFLKRDCIDLPQKINLDYHVDLSSEQKKHYDDMKKKLASEVVFDDGKIVSMRAANAAVKVGKLIQIAAGVVHAEDGHVVALDSKPRYELLKQLIEEEEKKTIVFVYHRPVAEFLAEALRKDGYTTAVVHGGVSKHKRDKIFLDFQDAEDPHVLVAHPRCMAHGLTLTAAASIVWYSVATPEDYYQACERIDRPGQTSKMRIIHITSTVEEKGWFYGLRNGLSAADEMLKWFSGKGETE